MLKNQFYMLVPELSRCHWISPDAFLRLQTVEGKTVIFFKRLVQWWMNGYVPKYLWDTCRHWKVGRWPKTWDSWPCIQFTGTTDICCYNCEVGLILYPREFPSSVTATFTLIQIAATSPWNMFFCSVVSSTGSCLVDLLMCTWCVDLWAKGLLFPSRPIFLCC